MRVRRLRLRGGDRLLLLFYASSYIFTGLAVAVAFHCGLFNIGGEGQAYLGGLGVTLVALYLGWLPWILCRCRRRSWARPCSARIWAFIPSWLQARRGSHVVITTIMFNFIASALMTYLLVNVLIGRPADPEIRPLPASAALPQMHDVLARWASRALPLNLSFVFALLCCLLVPLAVHLADPLRLPAARRRQEQAAAVYAASRPRADHARRWRSRARSPASSR